MNPEAGHESDPVPGPAAASRSVLVAGGGPAGLECARRLAERGHRVALWEAGDRLGGRLASAQSADPDLAGLLDWLVGAATDAGVELHLRREVTAETLTGIDVLVWAAGSTWPGLDDLRPWLDGGADPFGQHVAVVGGGKAALTLAGHARGAGHEVTVVSASPVLAPELGLPGRFRLVHDTAASGVELRVSSTEVPDADSVLTVSAGEPRPAPAHDGIELHVIGDASGTVGLGQALGAAARVAAEV